MSVILVAEDEEPLLELLCEALESMGHTALSASDGERALFLASSEQPELILSDFMMPRRSGVDLLQAVRAGGSKVPFILMSAAEPEGREAATMFLRKPITIPALQRAIDEVLGPEASRTPVRSAISAAASQKRGQAGAQEMMSWIGHELKNPLSVARVQSELMMRRAIQFQDEDQQRQILRVITQLDRMNALIHSMLDAGALANDSLVLHREPVDLRCLLDEAVQSWRELRSEATFALHVPDEPTMLSVDPLRLRQVLDNLISNAVKYGLPSRHVEVGLALRPGVATIMVTDRGPGIPASDLPHVFERFRRASTSKAVTGHGLGLFIASELTRLHGGTLTAKSALGHGTTFVIALPRFG